MHIKSHYDPSGHKVYAHFCSIVQSSGMGKSRTVDELGKEHFSIPLNLRDEKSTGIFRSHIIISFMTNIICCIFPGYPPADHMVRNFFKTKGTEAESYHQACCFIDALFQHTLDTLEREFNLQWGIDEVAREFRRRMTEGQTMKMHNEFRRQFYHQVIRIAKEKLSVVCLLL